MISRSYRVSRGFTLVEVIVSMGLGMVIMAAVFSTYLYLGRSLTQLSYKSMLERQSRQVLRTIVTDIQNTRIVTSASDTSLDLSVYNLDPSVGPVPTMAVAYSFSPVGANANKLVRNGVPLVRDIIEPNMSVSVSMLLPASGKLFNYSTTSGNTFATAGTGPTYQATTTLVPMSIKQVAINFTLRAGDPATQGQQGTLTQYLVSSGRILLVNRQLPDGS